MELFLKIISGILLAVMACLVLGKSASEMKVLLSIAVCAIAISVAVSFFQPVIEFCYQLEKIGKLDQNILKILLKAVGIALLSQITGLICADTGNQALGKTLQIIATTAVIWLSLPLVEELVALLDCVLGAV